MLGEEPQEVTQIEGGQSFIPESILVSTTETEAITDDTNVKARSILELQDVPPEAYQEESKKLSRFCDALGNLRKGVPPPKILDLIREIAIMLNIDKRVRYETCRGLLQNFMKDFGQVRYSDDHLKDVTWSATAWVINMFEVLEGFKDYFYDVMLHEDYDYFLRIYIGELVMPFYVANENNPLWMAKDFDTRMEMARKVSSIYGTVSQDQLEEYSRQAGAAIKKILIYNLSEKYYSPEDSDKKTTIEALRQKYNIELPSEFEFLKNKVDKAVEELETIATEIESKIKDPHLRFHLEEKRRSKIKTSIQTAIAKTSEEVLPQRAKPFNEWLASLNTRIQTARQSNFENLYSRRVEEMSESIETAITEKDEKKLQEAFDKFERFITEWEKFIKEDDCVKQILKEHLERVDRDISSSNLAIQTDPSKARDEGEKLTILGRIRNKLVVQIGENE